MIGVEGFAAVSSCRCLLLRQPIKLKMKERKKTDREWNVMKEERFLMSCISLTLIRNKCLLSISLKLLREYILELRIFIFFMYKTIRKKRISFSFFFTLFY